MSLTLNTHHLVMTGGSSGIGRVLLGALLEHGATVTVLSRRHPSTWEHPAPDCWDATRHWIHADLEHIDAALQQIGDWQASQNSLITGLIHCAVDYGASPRHDLGESSLDEWHRLLAVNARALFALARQFLPSMLATGQGVIINVASDVAFLPGPGRVAYAASKAASHQLCVSLAAELAAEPVNVVEFLPETQIITPGMRRRRPVSFDFAGYSSPRIFVTPVLQVVHSFGTDCNGTCFVVTPEGDAIPIAEHRRFQIGS